MNLASGQLSVVYGHEAENSGLRISGPKDQTWSRPQPWVSADRYWEPRCGSSRQTDKRTETLFGFRWQTTKELTSDFHNTAKCEEISGTQNRKQNFQLMEWLGRSHYMYLFFRNNMRLFFMNLKKCMFVDFSLPNLSSSVQIYALCTLFSIRFHFTRPGSISNSTSQIVPWTNAPRVCSFPEEW